MMPHVRHRGQRPMTNLTPEQLTGRVSTHVHELPRLSCRLHPGAAAAFVALAADAAHDGIDLVAASAFRDFNAQLTIWNGKFRGERRLLDRAGVPLDISRMDEEAIVRAILQWSALPGASRHHWGSEIDVFDRAALPAGARPRLVPEEYAPDGVFAALTASLRQHAARHGFFLPYDSDRGGVQPEPWHLSYAPVSAAALPALTLPVLGAALQGAALAGAAVVQRLLPEIHERYVRAVAAAPRQALAAASAPTLPATPS
jgi:LAS superfamily LD-carboxypeptidase LdcB